MISTSKGCVEQPFAGRIHNNRNTKTGETQCQRIFLSSVLSLIFTNLPTKILIYYKTITIVYSWEEKHYMMLNK